MFDPTAFDNMKVVIEGAVYDSDIDGSIVICDRNDIINMAKMSRCFEIRFNLNVEDTNRADAIFRMESGMGNLAAELLPGASTNLAGCQIRLDFIKEFPWDFNDFHELDSIFKDIWGLSRKIKQKVLLNPYITESKTIVITIDFERIISEEQIDDLIEMIDFMTETLRKLDQL